MASLPLVHCRTLDLDNTCSVAGSSSEGNDNREIGILNGPGGEATRLAVHERTPKERGPPDETPVAAWEIAAYIRAKPRLTNGGFWVWWWFYGTS